MESDVIIYTLSDSTTLTVYCESLHVFFFFSSILFYSKQVIIDLLLLSVKVATKVVVVEGGGGGVIIMLGAGIAQWLERRTVIERSRVRIPAGAAGEFSSPGSTFCVDSYFGIRSTPVLPQ